jgi:hypothetical protein
MRYIVAIFLLIVISTAAYAGQSYDCKKYGVLGDRCIYTGTTTSEDVKEYVEDAKQATLAILHTFKDVTNVDYNPKLGLVVIAYDGDHRTINLFAVEDIFESLNLKFEVAAIVRESNGRLVRAQKFSVGSFWKKGTQRFNALTGIPTQL